MIIGNSKKRTALYLDELPEFGNHEREEILQPNAFPVAQFNKHLVYYLFFPPVHFLQTCNLFSCQHITQPSGK